jgi:hypothetical protein
MRGVRLDDDGPILPDTLEARALALSSSSILTDRVTKLAMQGPPAGETWQDQALRYRAVVQDLDSMLVAALLRGTDPEAVVMALRHRLDVLAMAGAVSLRNLRAGEDLLFPPCDCIFLDDTATPEQQEERRTPGPHHAAGCPAWRAVK